MPNFCSPLKETVGPGAIGNTFTTIHYPSFVKYVHFIVRWLKYQILGYSFNKFIVIIFLDEAPTLEIPKNADDNTRQFSDNFVRADWENKERVVKVGSDLFPSPRSACGTHPLYKTHKLISHRQKKYMKWQNMQKSASFP